MNSDYRWIVYQLSGHYPLSCDLKTPVINNFNFCLNQSLIQFIYLLMSLLSLYKLYKKIRPRNKNSFFDSQKLLKS